EKYFSKIHIDESMCFYVKLLLASFLDGRITENFLIWTGSGCHAKGTKILMYDGSIKKVENIKIGDKLMGDDSKSRYVNKLFRGNDKMYKITPIIGKSYIINENHVLSLK